MAERKQNGDLEVIFTFITSVHIYIVRACSASVDIFTDRKREL
jgi:hypothetical protein